MGFDSSIKGWMSVRELRRIEEICFEFNPDLVVEVGCAYGRSTFAWADSVHQEATVLAVDKWENGLYEPFIHGVASRKEVYGKIIPLKLESPPKEWNFPPADIVFLDGQHVNPWFHDDLHYWKTKVREGGILCGHDYSRGTGEAFHHGVINPFQVPDVIPEVDALRKELGAVFLFNDFSFSDITKEQKERHELPDDMMSIWAIRIW